MKERPTRGPILETRSLGKAFGGVQVLHGLDLSVAQGAIRCLIGPNGSGKSTLLKTIAGVIPPDSGQILFEGHRIEGLRPFAVVRRGISMKLQIVRVYRELTVHQNLRIPAQRMFGSDDASGAVIERMLDLIGLQRLAGQKAGSLSHGQQQWLEIGMAITTGPRLLLLDEPTAGMTPEERERTAQIVLDLNREQGITVIVVEHDMNFVRMLDQPVSVLHQGRIFFEGTLNAVQSNPEVERIYFGARQ